MTFIEEKLTENRLRWYGHVQRTPLEALVRRVGNMVFSHVKRGRERAKRTWEDDLIINNISQNLVLDQAHWRSVIHIGDLT